MKNYENPSSLFVLYCKSYMLLFNLSVGNMASFQLARGCDIPYMITLLVLLTILYSTIKDQYSLNRVRVRYATWHHVQDEANA